MKRADMPGRSSIVFIGRGTIIISLIVTSSLGFILGFFIGKNYRAPIENQQLNNFAKEGVVQDIAGGEDALLNVQPREAEEALPTQETDAQKEDEKPQFSLETDNVRQIQESRKSQGARKYTVQVGAFKNPSDADALKEELSGKGYHAAVIASKTRKQENLYKVMVGEFSTREEAELSSLRIRKTEELRPFVTFRND